MRNLYYLLDENKNPYPIEDLSTWAQKLELSGTREVKQEEIDEHYISTVFLGLDHNHSSEGAPILFETMVFSPNPDYNQYQDRYETWDQALEGHKRVCEFVRAGTAIIDRPVLKFKI